MYNLENLFSTIRKRRYEQGKVDPKKVLEYIFLEIARLKYDWRGAWDILVELLADKLRPREIEATAKYFKKGFSFLPESKHKDLAEAFSDELDHYIICAQKDPWDHLGMIREEQIGSNKKFLGQVLTPKNVVAMMTRMTYGNSKPWNKPKTQLDPCVGTGRFLLYPSIMFPNHQTHPLFLFGVEIALDLYRACIVNLSLFSKHPYSILCANTLRLDPGLTGPTSPVWLSHGNRWDPPDMTQYYWKPPPPYKFSLKRFGEAK